MKIKKGTFKVREHDDDGRTWKTYNGSSGYDFPFYVHRKSTVKTWILSHCSTGYAVKSGITLKQARALSKALKEWPLFLMPTADTIVKQRSLLSTHKQQQLQQIVDNCGEQNE
jgi:hypothetical protein